MAVQCDYIKGLASDYKDMLSIIVGWLTGVVEGQPPCSSASWTKLQDYVDSDGERCVILKSQPADELPLYVGLKTFRGYEGFQQEGIQINAYTNFDPDLEWDCQAGSLAVRDNYNSQSHFYEGCPAVLVGNQPVCYWLKATDTHIVCMIRTPTVPLTSDYTKYRGAFVNEMFYLGWGKRLVPKEGYPYPMVCSGTTYTLGTPTRPIQRNFVYDNVYGSLRHIPPFYWDYMMYEGIQSLVFCYLEYTTTINREPHIKTRWPFEHVPPTNSYEPHHPGSLPLADFTNPICGPKDSEVTALLSIPTVPFHDGENVPFGEMSRKESLYDGKLIFTYDQVQLSNRALYFDGLWGWFSTYPVRNSFVQSLCHCTLKVYECGSHNYLNDIGVPLPVSAYPLGVKHDQIQAHFGWNPAEIVESFNDRRLLIPVYYSVVNSIMEMQSCTREEFGGSGISYDDEQDRIQIAGILDDLYFVPGLGLSAQDLLKISTPDGDLNFIVVQDVYRSGPFNLAVMKLGIKEWHEENPGLEAPRG